MMKVYLDNAATTKPNEECLKIYNEISEFKDKLTISVLRLMI